MVKIGPKIGPAFFDYVTGSQNDRRPKRQNLELSELLRLLPLFFLLLSTGVIIARLFYLQVIRASYYKDLSENNRTRTKIIPAPRGIIYDRNEKPLVSNSQIFPVPREQALKLMSEGKKLQSVVRREYLYKDAFAHVVGFLGQISEDEVILPIFSEYALSESIGKIGLEKTYEKVLHGQNGRELLEVDVHGREMRALGEREPVRGQNLHTTLDLDLQLLIKDAMSEVERGAVIAQDPKTGGILALYSKPSFDPNIFTLRLPFKSAQGRSPRSDSGQAGQAVSSGSSAEYQSAEEILADDENQPLLNRAIGGVYPPGSTFKLVTGVAALATGAIREDTIIEDTGVLKVGDFSFGNWYFLEYGKKEGPLNIVAAIKRSNDIFFYKAAERAGVENISSFSREFGFGAIFGIDIVGEAEGLVPSPSWKENEIGEQWYLGDTYNYGIGQGYLLTTPLQINVMTSVFANGGTLYRPHLVDSQKKILKKSFIKKEYLDLVREGMRQSCERGGVAWPFFDFKVKNERLPIDNHDFIEEGSGSAKIVRIKVACKTGTAEVSDKDKNPHAWITVFAPFYDPEIVLTVLVENGGEGSSVAGPIAKKILQNYFEKK
ncbi:MAG: hypothetical protein A3C30_01390 [Candidatus Levybacteria bacterium RIFCSPHIGHO2_02_FULL_40_18]|nr:MAG: hypothetical protein A2869_00955 [Candidatus Levybacteria bacterium RIFCSPHIGHO2_01_FULL_40_58]OGH26650.1 MAG: hypothetical protein A3C30_01390 [Candidatus Levybacteria bacterium RIFCSPHIGHO2_02_FULL_40_18]OGH31179.1 MAG: hypothetical protein A3E43_00225 [Candidatus Levybacteria bacterium RIFCSPHIGHO2_12_FULL_40_31]OGH39861.1 MAG: hypothetical protein A2894_03730 [Candidatus Levybacteria bacterium RIFCSPLOWO2_01_FULL_40_64]OGH48885.1 MAG: hypothetical protein A3I54_04835 [Candidatus Lev